MEHLTVIKDIGNQLKRNEVNLKKCPKQRLTIGYIECILECISEYWSNFNKAHTAFIKAIPKDKHNSIPYFANDEYCLIEDLYLSLKGNLKDMLKQSRTSSATTSTLVTQQPYQIFAKLPRIELPTFAGKYEDWSSFNDLFTTLVQNDKSLSKVHKLHYLKLSLQGDAELLLRHVQITESNYEQAWEILNKRYGNKRLIVNGLLQRLFGQKRCTNQTASQIKMLLDTTQQCLNGLTNEGVCVTSWDPVITYYVVQKLDIETHKCWEEHTYNLKGNDLPTWHDLKLFLEGKYRTFELVYNTNFTSATSEKNHTFKEKSCHMASTLIVQICPKCEENHNLSHCKKFSKLEPKDRSEFVRNKNLCFNCLGDGHSAFKCRVSSSCHICKRRHHSLLHVQRTSELSNKSQAQHRQRSQRDCQEENVEDINNQIVSNFAATKSTALLPTALAPVRNEKGFITTLRALLDTGSQANFISKSAAQSLNIKTIPAKGKITGVGLKRTTCNHVVNIELLSRHEDNFKLNIEAHIMTTRSTTHLPTRTIQPPMHGWTHLKGLQLADPDFYRKERIDLLLGVQACSQIWKDKIIKGPPGSPCAQDTNLGWILFGTMQETYPEETVIINHSKLNSILEIKPETKKEKQVENCQKMFNGSYSRNKERRYLNKLSSNIKQDISKDYYYRNYSIGGSKKLERYLKKNSKFKEEHLEEHKTSSHLEKF